MWKKILVTSLLVFFFIISVSWLWAGALRLNQFEVTPSYTSIATNWDWTNIPQNCFLSGIFSVYDTVLHAEVVQIDYGPQDYMTNSRVVTGLVSGRAYSVYVGTQNNCDMQVYFSSAVVVTLVSGGGGGPQDPPSPPEGPGGNTPAPTPLPPSTEGQPSLTGSSKGPNLGPGAYRDQLNNIDIRQLPGTLPNGQSFNFKVKVYDSNTVPLVTVSGNETNMSCWFKKGENQDWRPVSNVGRSDGASPLQINQLFGGRGDDSINGNDSGTKITFMASSGSTTSYTETSGELHVKCGTSISNSYVQKVSYKIDPKNNFPTEWYNDPTTDTLYTPGLFQGTAYRVGNDVLYVKDEEVGSATKVIAIDSKTGEVVPGHSYKEIAVYINFTGSATITADFSSPTMVTLKIDVKVDLSKPEVVKYVIDKVKDEFRGSSDLKITINVDLNDIKPVSGDDAQSEVTIYVSAPDVQKYQGYTMFNKVQNANLDQQGRVDSNAKIDFEIWTSGSTNSPYFNIYVKLPNDDDKCSYQVPGRSWSSDYEVQSGNDLLLLKVPVPHNAASTSQAVYVVCDIDGVAQGKMVQYYINIGPPRLLFQTGPIIHADGKANGIVFFVVNPETGKIFLDRIFYRAENGKIYSYRRETSPLNIEKIIGNNSPLGKNFYVLEGEYKMDDKEKYIGADFKYNTQKNSTNNLNETPKSEEQILKDAENMASWFNTDSDMLTKTIAYDVSFGYSDGKPDDLIW